MKTLTKTIPQKDVESEIFESIHVPQVARHLLLLPSLNLTTYFAGVPDSFKTFPYSESLDSTSGVLSFSFDFGFFP